MNLLSKWTSNPTTYRSSITASSEQVYNALSFSVLESKAKNILEIGFYYGASAVTMLELDPDITVTSIDPGIHDCTLEAAPLVKEYYGDRFRFIQDDSKNILNYVSGKQFDFAYVDGDHKPLPVLRDIKSCLSLNIPYLLFDDIYEDITESNYHPKTSRNGVSIAVNQMQLKGLIKPIKHWYIPEVKSKMKLYKTTKET